MVGLKIFVVYMKNLWINVDKMFKDIDGILLVFIGFILVCDLWLDFDF